MLKRLLILLFVLLIIGIVIFAYTGNQKQSTVQRILKPWSALQCGNELKASKLWQVSSLFLTADQQNHAQEKVCECVSENALNDVPTQDLLMATVNENAKNELVQQALINSLKGCVQEVLK